MWFMIGSFFYRVTHLVQYFLYLGQLKNFFRTVTDSSSIHEFCMNTSWGQFISKSSWTQTMNYSCPVHEHFMNGLKCSWFHELHFAGVWPSSSWEDVHGRQRMQTHSKRSPEWLMWAKTDTVYLFEIWHVLSKIRFWIENRRLGMLFKDRWLDKHKVNCQKHLTLICCDHNFICRRFN